MHIIPLEAHAGSMPAHQDSLAPHRGRGGAGGGMQCRVCTSGLLLHTSCMAGVSTQNDAQQKAKHCRHLPAPFQNRRLPRRNTFALAVTSSARSSGRGRPRPTANTTAHASGSCCCSAPVLCAMKAQFEICTCNEFSFPVQCRLLRGMRTVGCNNRPSGSSCKPFELPALLRAIHTKVIYCVIRSSGGSTKSNIMSLKIISANSTLDEPPLRHPQKTDCCCSCQGCYESDRWG